MSLSAVAMSSATAGWAVGEDGTILRYASGAWQRVASPTHADLYGVAVPSADEAWAVGFDVGAGHGVIVHEQRGRWSLVPTAPLPALRGIAVRSPADAWIVGDGGTILQLVRGAWTRVETAFSDNLYSFAFDTAGTAWVVGYTTNNTPSGGRDSSVIVRYKGGVWSRATPPAGTPNSVYDATRLLAVVAAANGRVWAVGASTMPRGWIVQTAGSAWIPSDVGAEYQLTAAAMASSHDGWAVGYNGEMLHFDGSSWNEVTRVTSEDLSGVALVAPGEGWAVGANHTILRLHQGQWTVLRS